MEMDNKSCRNSPTPRAKIGLSEKAKLRIKIDLVFHRLFRAVKRLVAYPHWLFIEKCQLSFYFDKLDTFSKAFRIFTITDVDNEEIPDWLVLESCHLSFYIDKLSSSSKASRIRNYLSKFLCDFTLNSLVSRILKYKKINYCSLHVISRRCEDETLFQGKPGLCAIIEMRDITGMRDFNSGVNDNPGLKDVGDRLAFEVARIYKAFVHDSQDFASKFYFDEKKFQEGEVFVGFQEEASDLLHRLASITKKKLEVISIVGMAGLGKTTLTKRLYNDPYIVSYFYVRSWVTCSQVYKKRDLLLAILRSVIEITDDVCRMNNNQLAHHLQHALMGQRYLIVIDDIWSSEAWDDLKSCFPNDNNGSKVLLTTRIKDVALHAQPDRNPLCLRFLTEEESFDLFTCKAFTAGNSFDDLGLIGKSITRKCCGLPLAIVVIAGLLKNNLERDWWARVAESVSSYITGTAENQYLDTLELSYNHLPQHLRPCFLSFGAFPEDHDIPVRKLIWLWISEGFIVMDSTEKSLEDAAEDYLMDLIRRSLVVVEKKGSNGAIKTCRIHDLLRDLCLRKVEEENFSPNIYKYNKHSFSCPHSLTNPSTKSQLLLTTDVHAIPSNCSCYSSEVSHSFFKGVPVIWDTSRLISSLDISSIEFFVFPMELLQLIHLRYLELRFRSGNPPESINQLRELRTLVMSSRMSMIIPNNMWKNISLKHLCIKSGENLVNFYDVEEEPSLMENLLTMSLVSPTRPCQTILAKTHNLQKLGLCGPLTTLNGDLKFPDLDLLVHLESLKLLNTIPLSRAGRLSDTTIFPKSLKCLSVSNTCLDWKESWIFEMIPNLEVLKLKFHAFVGRKWETSPKAFPCLKILKLDELNVMTWTASCNHFPMLKRLQVYQCPNLMEIPEDLGNICTLEWIELGGCSDAAKNSAKRIQKEQQRNGNDCKILLKHEPNKEMQNKTSRPGCSDIAIK